MIGYIKKKNETHKKTFLYTASALILAVLFSNLCNADASVKSSSAYLKTKEMYSLHPGQYDYVMFGDSITKSGRWNTLIPGYSIGNRGISGDDTAGMLDRITDVERTGAKTVFIMAGTNDITRKLKPEDVARNIILMSNKMKEKGITIVIQSTILSGEKKQYKNPSIKKINNILKDFSKNTETPYLDLNSSLSKNGKLKEEYTVDSTHLNAAGYKVWSKILKSYISGVTKKN
ncbi:GDSL-type esterase/lipase family protein [Klebsiella michiganensis]|uniref:GDSL-type esterase/lipase family protein n=2 Tax=Klebsiella michiganensis TaxID=1134687 RepID=UPI0015F771F4|nr:GDSL-type esterase/lipase family protein [Klebsiella michiganensis]MCZ0061312.1 GDSL-type esterase/lipase family protein [Klebsiella michiganensis]MCZ9439762.1 hypothetical protein [Klebsiella michiganensis]WAT41621.1 GDSL-type esterase/lipase family protein [Klebsiella michiganensis]WAX86417.1 GDSL-type esterase/lipase family protein [Klebsiella michiganensis]HDX8867705.1 hypothetical protein [Klebsiella michiganensis]